ncbi:GxGYxYP domain-containing protein [Gaoshiqia sediminis]|uniref:GxGYxYP family putative glycoside hydrolase n=1 Tax=Gaoshiqia sediminis TaxID=2986998 RepID=A0AA41Y5Q7_9BACT|nr:GxGYxYP domain-containing protein [Gaoshiqia sediminis]MCW0483921.1 GxGYxYP family putative glycoside hydrolase [Gaoshiqia sediminis]
MNKEFSKQSKKKQSIERHERRDFLKKIGLMSGGTAMGLLGLFPLHACGNLGKGQNRILVPNMHGMTYWEMLMFSCLQGLMNRTQANVFLYYPEKSRESWYSRYPVDDERVFYNWYKKYDHLQFEEIDNPYGIFEKIHSNKSFQLNGCVIVDTEVPATANIGANYASIENLLPVTETILKNNKEYLTNLPVKRDLRGQFQGMSKLEIYEWAFEQQWPQANHSRVANLGTPQAGPAEQMPTNSFHTSNRARDFTVAEKGFFFDLASGGGEYELKDRIFQAMDPQGYVFGWHQGAGETNHIRHLSKHGQLALGSSTYAANFSFHSRVEVPGAVERFREKVVAGLRKEEVLEEKIYLTFILSDGNSLNFITRRGLGGQWQLPERGKIPFGWEILPLLAKEGPGILDYFQATATENDFFVASVSGIADFYPRAVPKDKLRGILQETGVYLEKTGLSSGVVMGPKGPTDDGRVELYHEILGDKINGIIEGYDRRSAKDQRLFYKEKESQHDMVWLPTSNPRGGKALDHWIQEIKELSQSRTRRPLFVPLHIPAHKLTITDMVKLLEELGDDFKAVSPDMFYRLFVSAHRNSVVVNPPESFPPEEMILKAGNTNILTPELQNFSRNPKNVNLGVTVTVIDSTLEIQIEELVRLEKEEKTELELKVEIPGKFKDKAGQLEYFMNGRSSMRIPVKFI